MTNQEFKTELDKLLKPFGFKKNGNKWTAESEELEKIIYLQKSDYSNSYYLNYGYNFKDLEYDGVSMHIWNRYGAFKRKQNERISKTLDLTNSMEKSIRIKNLEHFVKELLNTEINSTNSKSDIIQKLKSRKHLNDVFLPVKRHLNLENYKNTAYNKGYNSLWQRAKSMFNL